MFWSDAARDDLHRIRALLSSDAAGRVGRIIAEAADCLPGFPDCGRPGSVPDTHELPLPGLPWRLVWRALSDGRITILRVME